MNRNPLRSRTLRGIALLATLVPLVTSATAATLQVTYSFNATGTAAQRLAPTSVLEGGSPTTNFTASAITQFGYNAATTFATPATGVAGAFILSDGSGSPGGHLSVFFPDTTTANDTESEVAALGHYFDIVLSPAAGYSLDLSRLAVDYASTNTTNNRNFFVRYNHTGAPTNFAAPNIMGAQVATADTWTNDFGSAGNLNGIPVVNEGESVTLRFFMYRGTANTTAQNFRFDDITITGDINIVPEPSTSLIAMIFATGLIGRRTRRRSAH